MRSTHRVLGTLLMAVLWGCGGSRDDQNEGDAGGPMATEFSEDGGDRFDVLPPVDLPPVSACAVIDDMEAPDECEQKAPRDSFEPNVQWQFTPPEGGLSLSTPLVANLTDDNGDGLIDSCDTPDVVVAIHPRQGERSRLYVFDGETGDVHFIIPQPVAWSLTPAIGDVDNDGLPEIVAYDRGIDLQQPSDDGLLVFEHDGSLKWARQTQGNGSLSHAIALGDVDNDGDVEIAVYNYMADHEGNVLFSASGSGAGWSATVLADLDGDQDLEMIQTQGAWHHDGTQYYSAPEIDANGHPQVANLDDDPQPEILVISRSGVSILEHDGTPKFSNHVTGSRRPATIHDTDGDGLPEFAFSVGMEYLLYDRDLNLIWSSTVLDASGGAAGTSFDFLGDGTAEAMYADEFNLFVFNERGETLFEVPRASITHNEYPVVADVDNDGSAEIVVVSNRINGGEESPTVQVIRDREDRWIQARRIWNQHTYHVTNVRENGTIPRIETPHWRLFNTFRSNAQILNTGGLCIPPEG